MKFCLIASVMCVVFLVGCDNEAPLVPVSKMPDLEKLSDFRVNYNICQREVDDNFYGALEKKHGCNSYDLHLTIQERAELIKLHDDCIASVAKKINW